MGNRQSSNFGDLNDQSEGEKQSNVIEKRKPPIISTTMQASLAAGTTGMAIANVAGMNEQDTGNMLKDYNT